VAKVDVGKKLRPQSLGTGAVDFATMCVGDFVMMLDGKGCPRFIWRTTEVTIKPLSQVDEAFAWDEGEGAEHHLRSGCRNRYCETSGLEHTEFLSHAFPIGSRGAVSIRSGLGGLLTCCQCLSAMAGVRRCAAPLPDRDSVTRYG